MASHEILISLPMKQMNGVDTVIEIRIDEAKRGELHISQGTVDWKSRGKKSARPITWERFADLLDEETGQQG